MLRACICLALVLLVVPLRADESKGLQQNLQQRFSKQVFTIRNFYEGDHLIYDSQGNLIKGNRTVRHKWCWCAAQLQIEEIEVKRDKLVLRGPRIVRVYDNKKKAFSKLVKEEGDVRVEIELDTGQTNEDAIVAVLEKIFLTQNDDLDSSIPDAWRAADFKSAGGDVAKVKNAPSPEQNVSAPRPIRTLDPEYSEEASRRRLQGSLVLWVVVDEKGDVVRIKLSRCLGMGLDEQAVQAVSQWKFQPAMRNGQPVAVQMNVEVTFHLYNCTALIMRRASREAATSIPWRSRPSLPSPPPIASPALWRTD